MDPEEEEEEELSCLICVFVSSDVVFQWLHEMIL
jgi:hypothetical protein